MLSGDGLSATAQECGLLARSPDKMRKKARCDQSRAESRRKSASYS
jgi:hypothetical protein